MAQALLARSWATDKSPSSRAAREREHSDCIDFAVSFSDFAFFWAAGESFVDFVACLGFIASLDNEVQFDRRNFQVTNMYRTRPCPQHLSQRTSQRTIHTIDKTQMGTYSIY